MKKVEGAKGTDKDLKILLAKFLELVDSGQYIPSTFSMAFDPSSVEFNCTLVKKKA